ncbi:hypothetical protein E4T56_gene16227 [Termitomyces sp. T112]|nr:hypothetical protein E4T56_gene16227 [Termitomyces sp. T112]
MYQRPTSSYLYARVLASSTCARAQLYLTALKNCSKLETKKNNYLSDTQFLGMYQIYDHLTPSFGWLNALCTMAHILTFTSRL